MGGQKKTQKSEINATFMFPVQKWLLFDIKQTTSEEF